MRFLYCSLIFCIFPQLLKAKVISVGNDYPYKTITSAFQVCQPGDTILCFDASIPGGMNVSNKHGSKDKWIYLLAADQNIAIVGGNNSIQFSDCSFIQIEGFTFQSQTGNGLNIDDGGSFDSPTHHIRIKNCQFKKLASNGNNDHLKLSGLDSFFVENCQFENGSSNGSGIDMVGCHEGIISQCEFSNMGSNAIQAKGGSAFIFITRNKFNNAGARAMNIGGSTGLEFFRPQDATSEAHDITVIANLIIGSEAAVAFVGCRNVKVSNNTLINPDKWVLRILQETVDPLRFLPCGENQFYNNVVIINEKVNIIANIGPNTEANTFQFLNNIWYKSTQPSWAGPQLPGILNQNIISDPKLLSDYKLSSDSPAISKGLAYDHVVSDYFGNPFASTPSLGFHEGGMISEIEESNNFEIKMYPNPCIDYIEISTNNLIGSIHVLSATGNKLLQKDIEGHKTKLDMSNFETGIYLIGIIQNERIFMRKIVKI